MNFRLILGCLWGHNLVNNLQNFDQIFKAKIFVTIGVGGQPRRSAGPHSAKAARADFGGKVEPSGLIAWRTLLKSVRAH